MICQTCKGIGANSPDAMQTGAICQGRGVRIMRRQVGPGMIQQTQIPCQNCQGQGKKINPKHLCQTCQGGKTVSEEKQYNLSIEKGVPKGHTYIFQGEGPESPGVIPGSLICVVEEDPHPVFQRNRDDLIMKKKITLLEALTGFSFELPFLNGKRVVISGLEGQVIKPGDKKRVSELGLRICNSNGHGDGIFGNFVIEFEVIFPESMNDPQITFIKQALGEKKIPPIPNKNEYFVMDYEEDLDDSDSDFEDPDGFDRVQCPTQ